MSHFLQTFHTAVWPGDGQSVKFWARSKLLNSRYPCKHRKGPFWESQRPISRDSNVPLYSKFSHSCMARRRTIGEILGQIKASELEISLQTQERGTFGGHKGPYLETRMSHFLQTFHTAVWPRDGQSMKFWARSKLPNSRYSYKHRKGAFLGLTKAHISRLECPTFYVEGLYVEGLYVEGLYVEGLYVDCGGAVCGGAVC